MRDVMMRGSSVQYRPARPSDIRNRTGVFLIRKHQQRQQLQKYTIDV